MGSWVMLITLLMRSSPSIRSWAPDAPLGAVQRARQGGVERLRHER
jgi:hypothetical protein